jgi:hypothetical protein
LAGFDRGRHDDRGLYCCLAGHQRLDQVRTLLMLDLWERNAQIAAQRRPEEGTDLPAVWLTYDQQHILTVIVVVCAIVLPVAAAIYWRARLLDGLVELIVALVRLWRVLQEGIAYLRRRVTDRL